MGKNKPNAFATYVKDEARRRERAGQTVNMPALFAELGPVFKALPDDVKQRYKDRANNINNGPPLYPKPTIPTTSGNSGSNQQTGSQASNNPQAAIKEDKDVKIKPEPGAIPGKANVKTEVKQERGEKRSIWAVELYQAPGSQQGQEDPDGERPRKKKPMGYACPNWKNIKNSTDPDGDRYFDNDLCKKRADCKMIVRTRAERLLTIPINTFSCNVLCKYKDVNKVVKYIPLEIGIYKYSIAKGAIGDPFNVIINSGPPPNNYFNDSKDHAAKTHKIGFTRFGVYPHNARNDYRNIYTKMCKYVRDGERTILVRDHRDIEQVQKSIEWLYEQSLLGMSDDEINLLNLPKPRGWTILPLVDFVTEAYNFVFVDMLQNPKPKFTLPYYLKMLLESSMWDYEPDYMCVFHKRDDYQTKWCAQSCAIRAVKCLESIFEEIYRNHELAIKPPDVEEEMPPQPPSPSGGGDDNGADEDDDQDSRPATYAAPTRASAQEELQPLYRAPI